jgi:hypothetical protein
MAVLRGRCQINPKRVGFVRAQLGSESIFRGHLWIRFCKTEEDFLSPHADGTERKIGGIGGDGVFRSGAPRPMKMALLFRHGTMMTQQIR